MSRGQATGRLWITTYGQSPTVPYFEQTEWHRIEIDVPKELEPKLDREAQWSVNTGAGETFAP